MIQCFDPETLKRFAREGIFKGPLVQLVLTESIANWRGDFEGMQTMSGLKEVAAYAHGIGPDVNLLEEYVGRPLRNGRGRQKAWSFFASLHLASRFGIHTRCKLRGIT